MNASNAPYTSATPCASNASRCGFRINVVKTRPGSQWASKGGQGTDTWTTSQGDCLLQICGGGPKQSIREYSLAYYSIPLVNIVQFFLYKLIIRILRLICKIRFATINSVVLQIVKIISLPWKIFLFSSTSKWLSRLLLNKRVNKQIPSPICSRTFWRFAGDW